MKHLILTLGLLSLQALAFLPVPKDQSNTPQYTGSGRPIAASSVTLTTTSYVKVLTLPTTGEDEGRHWKSISVYNPSSVAITVCFGTSSACTRDSFIVPSTLGLALDQLYYGPYNSVTDVWAKLNSAGSATPQISCW